MGRPPGKTKTFPRVVELLTAAVKEKGQKTIESETKLSQSMISRYLKGEGEPSQATLEKLAAYFKVSVAWLRGERGLDNDFIQNEIAFFIKTIPDLMEIYEIVPDHLKTTVLDYMDRLCNDMHEFTIAAGVFTGDEYRKMNDLIITFHNFIKKAR